jgi:hypothetical protein
VGAVGASVTINMTSDVLVGLIVNSHQDGALCRTWFHKVSWAPAPVSMASGAFSYGVIGNLFHLS